MSIDLESLVAQWHNDQPHPQAPTLKVGEYPVAARLATILRFGQGHPGPQAVANFWREFTAMNKSLADQNKLPVGPEEFEHLAQQTARSSFAYHGRPPSMYELERLRDAHPRDIVNYYESLPDQHYPTVPAGEMAKALQSAQPWAQLHLQREPNKGEAAYLYHSGADAAGYYQTLRDERGTEDQSGAHPGIAGAGDAGGLQAGPRTDDSRLAAGAASAGRSNGLSPR